MKYHQGIKLIIAGIFFVIILFFCGCQESSNEEIESDDQPYEKQIIGTWEKFNEFGNFTYKIIYNFFTNNSFFSGVQNSSKQTYDVSIWGKYSITSETISFTTIDPPSNSSLIYSMSNDGNTLLLYYEDEINFDVYKRIS